MRMNLGWGDKMEGREPQWLHSSQALLAGLVYCLSLSLVEGTPMIGTIAIVIISITTTFAFFQYFFLSKQSSSPGMLTAKIWLSCVGEQWSRFLEWRRLISYYISLLLAQVFYPFSKSMLNRKMVFRVTKSQSMKDKISFIWYHMIILRWGGVWGVVWLDGGEGGQYI